MSQIPYEAMNASEKTKYIGFKIFSDRELKDRQKAAVARRTEGFKVFMQSVLAQPELELGKHLDEKGLEKSFREPVNNFYQYAVDNGLSRADLEGIMDDIIQCAFMFKRTMNEADTDIMRLSFAFTGENATADVPLKKVMQLTEVMKEANPLKPTEYDGEPSLGQSVDEGVVDAVETPAEEAKTE